MAVLLNHIEAYISLECDTTLYFGHKLEGLLEDLAYMLQIIVTTNPTGSNTCTVYRDKPSTVAHMKV